MPAAEAEARRRYHDALERFVPLPDAASAELWRTEDVLAVPAD